MINELWTRQGVISAGGTVIAGAVGQDGQLLIATPAGIFRRVDESWLPLSNQPAIPFLQSFACSDGFIFLGGANLILFSADNGRTWNRAQIAALEKPVTCLAVSPRFSEDRVVLAGTDGAGILRSTDGGRHWHYSSFGLQDFSITALAPVSDWNNREVVFAATSTGLYRSPNGGRAWKYASRGLEGCVVLSIAPSPNFMDDGIVFGGTEADGIFRSSDGGFTWQPCPGAVEPGGRIPAINALGFYPAEDTVLAGLDDGRILRSCDRGDTWKTDANVEASVLCLFRQEDRLYAGTANAGLADSVDAGHTWETDPDLAIRQFSNLFSEASSDLFAFGADEGIWRSSDQGRSWGNVGDFESLLLTTANADDETRCRLAGTAQGLFRADDSDSGWQLVSPLADVTTIYFSKAFAQDHRVWVGTWSGAIFVSEDGGRAWQPIQPPPARAPVVSLGVFHDHPDSEQLISITFNARSQTLTLWRSIEAGWQIWLESPSAAPSAHIVASVSSESFVSMGDRCWHWVSGAWRCILKTDKPILRLLCHPARGLIALTADSILYSTDLVTWTTLNQSPDGSFNDVALLPYDEARVAAYILTRGGGLIFGMIPE